MTATVFVDTNVLIYVREDHEPRKQQLAISWMRHLWDNGDGRISYQVLQEYFNKMTQKKPGLLDQARADVRDLLAWNPTVINAALLERAWKIQDRYRFAFWDSLIVAAAKASSCRWLLTEDLHDGQNIDGLTVLNPFLHSAEEIFVRS
jgi:predicted nucleic acid-binding protein